MPPLRLCRIVTTPYTFATLLPTQLRAIIEAGIDLTIVSSPGVELQKLTQAMSVRNVIISMVRQPHPLTDIKSLITLIRFLRREKFDIIHSSTPKAGLLTAIAGWLVGIPIRIHTYTGQVWVERQGLMRLFLRWTDWLVGRLNTHLYADSNSQRDLLIRERIVPQHKIRVIADGSISGVDLTRFDPNRHAASRAATRRQLHIPDSAVVIIFVGRLTKDKGINELIDAFRNLRLRYDNIWLLLIGPFEPENDPLTTETMMEIKSNPCICAVGHVPLPEVYLAASDIFCLPSYREGFGSVVIEAGAMHLPAVATAVVGVVDAVVNNETGLLVPPKDVESLAEALSQLICSSELRNKLGQAAYVRSVSKFDDVRVNREVVNEYFRILSAQPAIEIKGENTFK
ncbi:MAG: glycosyltransferase family 4 protein [Nitrospirae bacterium]|nr:glycosyltransferase family 4 protein [Nitrospirota bacterium]